MKRGNPDTGRPRGSGLVAPREEFAPLDETPARFEHRGGHNWPSYQIAVGFPPINRGGTD